MTVETDENEGNENNNWIVKKADDLNFDPKILLDQRSIKTTQDLDDRIRSLAVHILKFHDVTKSIKGVVAQYFIQIRQAAYEQGYTIEELRTKVESIFKEYEVSDSYIRKVIPHELKDDSRTNIRYRDKDKGKLEQPTTTDTEYDVGTDIEIELKNAKMTIMSLAAEVKELKDRLANSIMVGQETRIYKGIVQLDKDQLPITVAINLKDDRLEYVEIDTEAIRKVAEGNLKIE
jgi:hypothetical protein